MLIEQALMTYLLAQSGITDLVGQRIYFVIAPQETAKPYIVVSKIDAPAPKSRGKNGLVNPRFQISVFSTTYGESKNISAAVKSALDQYTGLMGGDSGVRVLSCFFEDENDFYEEATGLFHVANDYKIWHRE